VVVAVAAMGMGWVGVRCTLHVTGSFDGVF
jgi:hypothetical protein